MKRNRDAGHDELGAYADVAYEPAPATSGPVVLAFLVAAALAALATPIGFLIGLLN